MWRRNSFTWAHLKHRQQREMKTTVELSSQPYAVEKCKCFFINGWRIAALLSTQHTGQPKLRESDNSVTAHQPVVSKQSCLLCVEMARSKKSHRQAAIGENEMTTERMRNAARDIFQHISSLRFFFFFTLWQYTSQEWEDWWTNQQKMHLSQLSFILSESYRIWPSAYPLLCPESECILIFFFFLSLGRGRS